MTRGREARIPAAVALERRYRWLFACYPAAYRAASEDEMLGVALAGAAPGQRWPSWGEAWSMIMAGTRMRLSGLLSSVRGPAWCNAAARFAFLAAALLATIAAEALVGHLLPLMGGGNGPAAASGIAQAAVWLLAAAVAALGWRRAAAVITSLGAVGEAAVLAARYAADPSSVVSSWWQLVLAVTAALAAVIWLAGAPGPAGTGRPLSWRAVTAVAVTAAVAAAGPAVESALTTVTSSGPGFVVSSPIFGFDGYLRSAATAAVALPLLVVIARLSRPVRRRVLLLAVPAVAAGALTELTFGGFLASSPRFAQPVLLTAPQWAALTVFPILGLAAGTAWLRRHEQMLSLIASSWPGTANGAPAGIRAAAGAGAIGVDLAGGAVVGEDQ